jgi:hypothetical protein
MKVLLFDSFASIFPLFNEQTTTGDVATVIHLTKWSSE